MLGVSALELLIVYAIPVAIVLLAWLAASAFVFVLARFSPTSALGGDLRHRVAVKQRNRSGRNFKLSFGYISLALAGDNCVQATVLHRAASRLNGWGLRSVARAIHAFSKFLTHIDISPRAEIQPGLYLYHGLGTVIGKGATIGRNALICQNVTLGGGRGGAPMIGDDVRLWAGAKVIGGVTIGDRAEIGANGVVIADVPPDTVAVGVPAKRHIAKGETVDVVLD